MARSTANLECAPYFRPVVPSDSKQDPRPRAIRIIADGNLVWDDKGTERTLAVTAGDEFRCQFETIKAATTATVYGYFDE